MLKLLANYELLLNSPVVCACDLKTKGTPAINISNQSAIIAISSLRFLYEALNERMVTYLSIITGVCMQQNNYMHIKLFLSRDQDIL